MKRLYSFFVVVLFLSCDPVTRVTYRYVNQTEYIIENTYNAAYPYTYNDFLQYRIRMEPGQTASLQSWAIGGRPVTKAAIPGRGISIGIIKFTHSKTGQELCYNASEFEQNFGKVSICDESRYEVEVVSSRTSFESIITFTFVPADVSYATEAACAVAPKSETAPPTPAGTP